jgi:hypothetical protein
VLRLLVTTNIILSSPFLVTLMMEAIRSSETWAHTRVTQRHIPEDGNLHSHCREKLISSIEVEQSPETCDLLDVPDISKDSVTFIFK